MKKLCLFVLFLFSVGIAHPNVTPMSSAIVSELYFDVNGDWTIELYFKYYDPETDTGYVMRTPTDTAFFKKFPDSTNYVLLTNADLSKPITINNTGDKVWFENWILDMEWGLTSSFIFGDFPGSRVNAPYPGQSLVNKSGHVVKDTASSLGFSRDPAKGILRGHIYDSVGNPLPYIRVQTYGVEARTLWPDEDGFFTDTLYAKNYGIFIYNNNPNKIYSGGFPIEPDSTSIHDIHLPVAAQIEFSGYSYLVGNEDHSNTKVILRPQCPFAPPDTITTDSSGYYSKMIAVGHYYLRYSQEGYLPYFTYTFTDTFFDYEMYDTYLEEGIVHEIAGGLVSGKWLADYPYWIFSNIKIEENDSLIIDPGAQIDFKRVCRWDVFGTLLAEGTEEDSILIQSHENHIWGPVNFWQEGSGNSKLSYVDIRSQTSMNFYSSSPTIEKSLITWNGDLCFFNSSSPQINECYFDYGVSLVCYDSSSPIISNNYIVSPGNAGISCRDHSTPQVLNNDFFSNWVAILCGEEGQAEINSNIFQKGGYAIDIRYGQAPTVVKHNIFYNLSDPIWGNSGSIPGFGILDTTNINGDTCDIYFNLFMDPLLNNPDSGDYSLLINSPCIDAGDPEFPFDPDSTIADMGARYFDKWEVSIQNRNKPNPEVKLFHYPNPAGSFVNFVVEGDNLHKLKNARIKIFNLSGNKMGEISCPSIGKGFGKKIYHYNLDGNYSLKSGTYIYTFEANGKILSTGKMTLIR